MDRFARDTLDVEACLASGCSVEVVGYNPRWRQRGVSWRSEGLRGNLSFYLAIALSLYRVFRYIGFLRESRRVNLRRRLLAACESNGVSQQQDRHHEDVDLPQ